MRCTCNHYVEDHFWGVNTGKRELCKKCECSGYELFVFKKESKNEYERYAETVGMCWDDSTGLLSSAFLAEDEDPEEFLED